MITDLKKFVFFGIKEDLNPFLERAQTLGFVEFIDLEGHSIVELSKPIQNLISAIKILKKQPHIEPEKISDQQDGDHLANRVISDQDFLEQLLEKERVLKVEMTRIKPLGNFSSKDIKDLEKEAGRCMQFFSIKTSKIDQISSFDSLVYIARKDDRDYFLSISKEKETYPELIEMSIENSFNELEEKLKVTQESIKKYRNKLKENTSYIKFLKGNLLSGMNTNHLVSTAKLSSSYMEGAIFGVEGWVPKNQIYRLFSLLKGLGVHAEESAVIQGEKIPTYMENTGYGKNGEDLVHIYDTPSPQDKDPSSWVFWTFAFFFSIIISDAGYGAIYLLIALFLKKKFSRPKPAIKRFFSLFTMIASFCIIWGVLAGSYFGIELQPKSPLNKVSLTYFLAVKKADYHIQMKDDIYKEWTSLYPRLKSATSGQEFLQEGTSLKDGVLKFVVLSDFKNSIFTEIALLIGILHICLAFLRVCFKNFAGIGWVFAIIGGYLYFPTFLDSTSIFNFLHLFTKEKGFEVGLKLLIGGGVLAVALGVLQNKWKGLLEMTKPLEIFADILSYLRLYALGLAGMIMATTFNDMARETGFVLSFIILLIGHGINISVGIMGGTIHGLRLNFIEWYRHCFEGGGKLFNPLRLLK